MWSFSLYHPPVPVPSLAITVSGSQMAGDPLTLNCTYDLSSSVDTSVATEVKWLVNGSAVAEDGRISASGSSLTFSPLNTPDTGRYVCVVSSNNVFIIIEGGEKRSDEYLLSITSKQHLRCWGWNSHTFPQSLNLL